MPSKETSVSWDKLGRLIFEDYTELRDVASLDSMRKNSSLIEDTEKQHSKRVKFNSMEEYDELVDSGVIKIYTTRLLKDDKWEVIDQQEYTQFQGTEIECLKWIDIKNINPFLKIT